MATQVRPIMILFPGLTHAGKLYDYGDIEKEPDDFLVEAAISKEKMFHRDSNKMVRMCKFVSGDERVPETDVEIENETDELEQMMGPELELLAISLGLQKKKCKDLKKKQLRKAIRFLRRL